jgi:hypothetical protein
MNNKDFYLDDDGMKNMLMKLSEDARRKMDSGKVVQTFEYDCRLNKKIFTPSKFNVNDPGEANIDNLLNLVRKKAEYEKYSTKFESLTLLNWLEAYNKLNENNKLDLNNRLVNFYEALSGFYMRHTFSSKDDCVICEVSEIKIIDSLQVIECKVKNLIILGFQ